MEVLDGLAEEVREFQETRAGVKGLVDSGTVRVPNMFIHQPQDQPKASPRNLVKNISEFKVPMIDLRGLEFGRRREIVDEIREAAETWGFFQMINHGIPNAVMDQLLQAQRRFHEQPGEVKMELYSPDTRKQVRFYSNIGIVNESRPANWRDTLASSFPDGTMDPPALPTVCRKELVEYMKRMLNLKDVVSELLSEALGLSRVYLSQIECMKSATLLCHYYPACPEPQLTLGTSKHTDSGFLTFVLQDNIGGLQVLHQDNWIDVPPINGALVANLGDLMQLITNDKFKSVEHRVLAKSEGPRLSAACFFYPSTRCTSRPYGPINELLFDDKPPIYRETLVPEYQAHYFANGFDGPSTLPCFKR